MTETTPALQKKKQITKVFFGVCFFILGIGCLTLTGKFAINSFSYSISATLAILFIVFGMILTLDELDNYLKQKEEVLKSEQ